MSDTTRDPDGDRATDGFDDLFAGLNESVAASLERNVEAQTALVAATTEAVFGNTPDETEVASGVAGSLAASEVWLDATRRAAEEMSAAVDNDTVDPERFRDIWLEAANDSLAELVSTDAFAGANGEFVEAMLDRRQELADLREESLAQAGVATQADVSEVAERLIELERRQHDIERKLDDLLEAVE